MISLFTDIYRTRVDAFDVDAADYGLLAPGDEFRFASSVGQEPLQLLSFIALNDRPYTEIVTADYTMSNELLGSIWPVDYTDPDPGDDNTWSPAKYVDGRPNAGILSSNAVWWRYGSTMFNSQRGRANAVSRILMCHDYLTKPIIFTRDIDASDEEALKTAIRTNEGCVACHASLDPLAANFWGFQYSSTNALVRSFYHEEQEFLWEGTNMTAPGYYGVPTPSLQDLGREMAKDPRLVECMTRQMFEGLLRRSATFADTESLVKHREVFVDSGTILRDLMRSIFLSPEYRNESVSDESYASSKLMDIDLFGSQLQELTGFRFVSKTDNVDMLLQSGSGLRGVAGAADGQFVTVSARTPTVPMLLVFQRTVEAASDFAVEREVRMQSRQFRKLFPYIDFTETPDTNREAMIKQIQFLYLRLFGVELSATDSQIAEDLALWQEIEAVEAADGKPEPIKAAWKGLLTALMRHPGFMLY